MHCQMIWSLWTIFILSLTKTCKGIDGPLGLKGKPECTSTTCEDANCAAIDDWNLFSQTCAILANHQKKTCNWNIGQVLESDFSAAKVYSLHFETTLMLSDGEGNLSEEKLVSGNITTDPIISEQLDSNSIALDGKLKFFIDGSTYCDEKIRETDCYYDVRLIIENGRLQIQLRYISDLENAKPSLIKPPIACMTLCSRPGYQTSEDTKTEVSSSVLVIENCPTIQTDKNNECFSDFLSLLDSS